MQDEKFVMDSDFFLRAFVNGWIVDGRDGGYIQGRSHDNGHIIMISPSDKELGEYLGCGLVEGGEFIMSPQATIEQYERLAEINSDNSQCTEKIEFSELSKIINTHAEPHDKFLVVQSQFIINKNSTIKHFNELQKINNRYPYHNGRVLSEEIISALLEIKF